MSRSARFLGGAAFAYLNQISVALVGLWLTPFYLRTLGAHDYGVWLVGMQILNFLVLCDLGVIAVLPRDVAQAHGRELNDPHSGELKTLVGRTSKIVLLQTALIAALGVALFILRPASSPGLPGAIALVLAGFILTYPVRLISAVLQGLQDLTFLGQIRFWSWAVSVVVIVVLLMLGARYYSLAIGWCVLEGMGSLAAVLRLRYLRPELVKLRLWRDAGPIRWSWFSRGLWVSLGQVSFMLVAGTDLLVVARWLGAATVVIYSCTGKVVQVLQQQPQALAAVALPGLSHMKASESRDRIRRAATSLTQAMILLGGGIVCVVLPLNQQFVGLWTGPSYFGGVPLTVLFLVNFIARLIDYTLALALFAFGYEKLYAIRSLLDGAVSVSLACLLVGPLGLKGVMLGFTCGVLFVAIPMDMYLCAREFQVSLFDIARPYFPYIWRIAALSAVGYVALHKVQIPNLLVLCLIGTGIGLVYLLIVLPYLLKSELGDYVRAAAANVRTRIRARFGKLPEPVASARGTEL